MRLSLFKRLMPTGLVLLLPTTALAAENTTDSGTTAWMLTSTALVLLMIPGLAMFYGGLVRTKNVLGTMMHSFAAMAFIGVLLPGLRLLALFRAERTGRTDRESNRRIAVVSLSLALILLAFGGATAVRAAEDPASSTAETVTQDATLAEDTADAVEAASESPPPTVQENSYAIDNMILLIAAVLVLFMQSGFAMVECGFNESKNAVNILFKNLMDLSIGVLLFYIVGYNLMYGADVAGGFLAWGGFGISETLGEGAAAAAGTLHPQVDWLFQVAFAATAATIVSGAVAGRMKFSAYLTYSAVLTGLIYPISGFWKWGGGWLDALGFHDFAGSLVVHAVGGFAGLAGAIVLGPRIGRYSAKGKSQAIPGHNLPLATLGVFILWVGWYGFNPGSQLAFTGAVNTDATVLIAVNTTLAAGAGAFLAMLAGWGLFKKPDLSMALNGALAGLVGITANCDCVSNQSAIIIGSVAGVLVVAGIVLLDKLKIDDSVGGLYTACAASGAGSRLAYLATARTLSSR